MLGTGWKWPSYFVTAPKKLDSADLNTYKRNNGLKLNPCLC